jgi:2-oxoacid:acceptor oxidoreductase delta subunit (pyruvate/2-ketoisovalerate family)
MTDCKIGQQKRKRIVVRVSEPSTGPDAADRQGTRHQAVAEARRCFGTQPCDGCDVCVLLCPDLCITRDPETGKVVIDYDYCKGCGICAFVCPKGAITMVLEE